MFLWSWWSASCPFLLSFSFCLPFQLFIIYFRMVRQDVFSGTFCLVFQHLGIGAPETFNCLRADVQWRARQGVVLGSLRGNYGSGRATQQQRFQIDCRRKQLRRTRVILLLFWICDLKPNLLWLPCRSHGARLTVIFDKAATKTIFVRAALNFKWILSQTLKTENNTHCKNCFVVQP